MKKVKSIMLCGAGGSLFLIGLAGVVLPILPGILLAILGLSCCAKGSERFDKLGIDKKVINYLKQNKVVDYLKQSYYKTTSGPSQ